MTFLIDQIFDGPLQEITLKTQYVVPAWCPSRTLPYQYSNIGEYGNDWTISFLDSGLTVKDLFRVRQGAPPNPHAFVCLGTDEKIQAMNNKSGKVNKKPFNKCSGEKWSEESNVYLCQIWDGYLEYLLIISIDNKSLFW